MTDKNKTFEQGLARIIPQRLTEAREARGYNMTELAEKLGVTRQAVSKFELGQAQPGPETMWRIVKELSFPMSFFTSPPEYNHRAGTVFFRSFKSATATARKSCKRWTDWLVLLHKHFEEFLDFPAVNLPEVQAEWTKDSYTFEHIELMAKACREKWGLGNGPINNLTGVMEKNGIIITRINEFSTKIDAFSAWYDNRPFVVLGAKTSAVRSRFDAAHELGHLILHQGIEHLEDENILNQIEREANRFASAFLLPASTFQREIFSTRLSHFTEMKRRWKVSIQAMLYRCDNLGILSQYQILNLRKELGAKGYRKKEPLDDEIPLENPTLMSLSANMILENNLATVDDFQSRFNLFASDIESLCLLSEGTLARYLEPSTNSPLQIKKLHDF